MTTFQTVAKYVAIALAILLIGTIVSAALSLSGIFGAIGEEEALPKGKFSLWKVIWRN